MSLGYPRELLAEMPKEAKASFAGVSNVAVFAEIPLGSAVLDLGCGAGLDSLIAARKAGESGRIFGVDFSPQMLDRARCAARRLGLDTISLERAAGEELPFCNAAFDLAAVNGIFNLNPQRSEIFRELARVLKPGGRAYGAELVLRPSMPRTEEIEDPARWFA